MPIYASEKGYYHGVFVFLNFNNQYGVNRKEQQADVNPDPDEEDMEYVILDNERQPHCRIVFKDNGGGVDDQKTILRARRWDVYMNKKNSY